MLDPPSFPAQFERSSDEDVRHFRGVLVKSGKVSHAAISRPVICRDPVVYFECISIIMQRVAVGDWVKMVSWSSPLYSLASASMPDNQGGFHSSSDSSLLLHCFYSSGVHSARQQGRRFHGGLRAVGGPRELPEAGAHVAAPRKAQGGHERSRGEI